MPTFWVSFAGNWDTTSQYAVQAGAEDVGSALAGAMNFGRHQDNLAARKSGDPLIPRGRVTAKQAFYRTYGNITFVRKSPGTVDGWGWSQVGSRGEIWIDAVGNTGYWKYGRQNTAHELGHGLAQLTGWDRARGNYNAYADIASAQIAVDGEVLRMGFQRQSWRGYQLVQGRTWPWQQNTASTPNEEFADMFLGWVYNGFASDSFGAARYNWMATNMAEWIALASQ